jgi:hypothetical protein
MWPTTIRIAAEDLKLLVTSPRGDHQIKAPLPLRPPHPRALLTLLEGVALFSGEPLYPRRARTVQRCRAIVAHAS